jgi:flagellar M-ring protein FliF
VPSIDINQLKERAGTLLHGFTRGQKTMLVVAIGAFLVGGLVFVRWAAEPSWAPLYGDLTPEDAAGVTSQLSAMGVPYRIGNGGGSVMVPRDRVYQTRLDLSAQGLPSAGAPGYSLLDEQGITTSQFKQRVDYQRALEGELARTIRSIDAIDAATVHLVIPQDDLFSDDEKRPTASVLVKVARNHDLGAGQVASIVHLVSSSVESLKPTDVTVADSDGRLLSTPGEDGLAAAAGDARAAQTERFERSLASSIEELLVPVAGQGRAKVRVNAQLDFNRRTSTSETFVEPETAPVVAEVTSTETYTGTGNTVGGVLGPDAAPVNNGTETDYTAERAERTYAVGKFAEQIEAAPGTLERLSVAVLVDERVGAAPGEIRQLVSAAAGLDLERGDTLEVSMMRFDDSALDAARADLEAQAGGESSPLLPLARTGGVVAIVALVLFLAWRSTKASAVARYPLAVPIEPRLLEAAVERELPVGEDLDDEGDELDLTELEAAPPSVADQERITVTSQIGDLIDRQPDEVAQVLRGWLADRRG